MEQFCNRCAEYQRVHIRKSPRVPLQVMPIIAEPFTHVTLDMISPLPKSTGGNQFILVLIDYATRYPETVLPGVVTSPKVAE